MPPPVKKGNNVIHPSPEGVPLNKVNPQNQTADPRDDQKFAKQKSKPKARNSEDVN